MENRITVHQNGTAIYDIVMEHSFEQLVPELKKIGADQKRICIVTDTTIGPLYADQVKNLLETQVRKVVVFTSPAGEQYKTLDTVTDLYTVLIEEKFDRNDMLLALGGGVIGDLTGFAAATYLRGIEFVQIPTTLLAQVDSSVGGKTGVDFDRYKNMVGAFCMPKLVYMNLATLDTLDPRVYLSGMGEVIKYGLIRRPEFYQWIGQHVQAIKNRDPEAVLHMVSVSCDTKRIVVEEDPLERSVRALLNLGHTLGHAIEKKKDFSLYHGECVAIGMVAAAQMSYKRGYLTAEQVEELKELLQLFELPIDVDGLNAQEVLDATKNDKKMIAGQIKFILLKAIGEGIVDRTVTEEEMAEGLSAVLK